VPIAGNKSVQACCDAHFVPEILEGENQYLCEKCNRKVDAKRQCAPLRG
jgi:ubiquitin C-terminal hydrolase